MLGHSRSLRCSRLPSLAGLNFSIASVIPNNPAYQLVIQTQTGPCMDQDGACFTGQWICDKSSGFIPVPNSPISGQIYYDGTGNLKMQFNMNGGNYFTGTLTWVPQSYTNIRTIPGHWHLFGDVWNANTLGDAYGPYDGDAYLPLLSAPGPF